MAIAVSPYAARKCERQDLNLHGLPHWILSPARLPIPPLSHGEYYLLFYNDLGQVSSPLASLHFGSVLSKVLSIAGVLPTIAP